MKNYERLVFKFLRDFNFISAEWRDDALWCLTEDDGWCNSHETQFREGSISKRWLELEDVLRQRNIKPFALDTARSEMNK